MGGEVDKDFGNEVDVKSTETIKMVSTSPSPFQPLKNYRVVIRMPQIVYYLQAVSKDDAERKGLSDFAEEVQVSIVEEITELTKEENGKSEPQI